MSLYNHKQNNLCHYITINRIICVIICHLQRLCIISIMCMQHLDLYTYLLAIVIITYRDFMLLHHEVLSIYFFCVNVSIVQQNTSTLASCKFHIYIYTLIMTIYKSAQIYNSALWHNYQYLGSVNKFH